MNQKEQEIVELTQRLLDSIANADWPTYEALCDPALSAFEPEARGHLVEGMGFHQFYFRQKAYGEISMTISSPRIWLMGDSAVIAYVRLNQIVATDGSVTSSACEETRVWRRSPEGWQHIHFHRSANQLT